MYRELLDFDDTGHGMICQPADMLLNHKCKHKDKYIKYNMNYKTNLDKQLNVVDKAISRKKENVAQKRQLQLGHYSYYSVHQFNT